MNGNLIMLELARAKEQKELIENTLANYMQLQPLGNLKKKPERL